MIPTLQKVIFSASNASNKEGIKFSAYPTVKLLITKDEEGKTPADYYERKTKKTFKAGGTEIPIKKGVILIDLESESGEGKTYYIQQFDLDATNKTSYRLARVASFNLTYKGSLKSVALALVENKVMVESEKTGETEPTHSGKSKSKSSKAKGETKGKQSSAIPPGPERWVTIKDKNFLNYLKKTIPGAFNEKDEMDRISPLIKNLKKMILFFKQIETLDEIKYFTDLTELSCSHTQIANLDLSQNKSLIKLDCSHTPIANLDLSQNTNLMKLDCSYTQLTGLQLENNTQLTDL